MADSCNVAECDVKHEGIRCGLLWHCAIILGARPFRLAFWTVSLVALHAPALLFAVPRPRAEWFLDALGVFGHTEKDRGKN